MMPLTSPMGTPSGQAAADAALHRLQDGVRKGAKKAYAMGSGRAWREEEEAYLLRTRLRKMPYKHIAAHINKTELACRLHYHQLCHGSARRKRQPSSSSESSGTATNSPALAPSSRHSSVSRALSPPASTRAYLTSAATASDGAPYGGGPRFTESPHRLPIILPRPEHETMRPPGAAGSSTFPRVFASPPARELLPPMNVRADAVPEQSRFASGLRLDCKQLPPPSMSCHAPAHVDMARLRVIYEEHCRTFWAAIADSYGWSTPPSLLEEAWRTGRCCPRQQHEGGEMLTPTESPETGSRPSTSSYGLDKTRIASILSVNREPMPV